MTGTMLGHYRLLRKLGEGGMGTVYEAIHEHIGRRAAIKVLHAELSDDPQFATRFLNEARAVNVIAHAGMVSVYDIGEGAGGVAYIVMEYLEGESLAARLAAHAGPLPQADALRIARQMASTLSAAHQQGVIHRDLKPENVMLVPEPEVPGGERSKLLDFGIAKLAQQSGLWGGPGGTQLKTRTGVAMGTPAYMSPEQCRGAADLDGRADVYSLGVMLYEMLTGQPPFVAEGAGQIVAMHLRHEPPPLPPGVDGEVGVFVLRMLGKDRAARPAMAEVAEELEHLGAPRVAATLASATASPAGSRSPRPAVALPALGLIMLIISVALSGASLTRRAARPPAPRPPAPAACIERARPVRWLVTSEPPGAQVVHLPGGQVLGQTPWREERPAAQGLLSLALRQPGFREEPFDLDRSADALVRAQLRPLPAPAAPPPAASTAPARMVRRPPPRKDPPAPAAPESKDRSHVDIPLLQ